MWTSGCPGPINLPYLVLCGKKIEKFSFLCRKILLFQYWVSEFWKMLMKWVVARFDWLIWQSDGRLYPSGKRSCRSARWSRWVRSSAADCWDWTSSRHHRPRGGSSSLRKDLERRSKKQKGCIWEWVGRGGEWCNNIKGWKSSLKWIKNDAKKFHFSEGNSHSPCILSAGGWGEQFIEINVGKE